MSERSAPKVPDSIMNAIRELVFGLEDGLVSTMGAVAGVAAGTEHGGVVVLSGLVLVAVEALSMAAGSYLSTKSHREMLEKKFPTRRRGSRRNRKLRRRSCVPRTFRRASRLKKRGFWSAASQTMTNFGSRRC